RETPDLAPDLVLTVLLVDDDGGGVAVGPEVRAEVLSATVDLQPVVVIGEVSVGEHEAAAAQDAPFLGSRRWKPQLREQHAGVRLAGIRGSAISLLDDTPRTDIAPLGRLRVDAPQELLPGRQRT